MTVWALQHRPCPIVMIALQPGGECGNITRSRRRNAIVRQLKVGSAGTSSATNASAAPFERTTPCACPALTSFQRAKSDRPARIWHVQECRQRPPRALVVTAAPRIDLEVRRRREDRFSRAKSCARSERRADARSPPQCGVLKARRTGRPRGGEYLPPTPRECRWAPHAPGTGGRPFK